MLPKVMNACLQTSSIEVSGQIGLMPLVVARMRCWIPAQRKLRPHFDKRYQF